MPVAYPLKIGPNARHLVDQNGVPFLIKMLAGWDHTVRINLTDAGEYFDALLALGGNATLGLCIESPINQTNVNGDKPFAADDDFSNPNPAYWSHRDAIMDLAASKGVLEVDSLEYLGHVNSSTDGWYPQMLVMGNRKCLDYGRFVGNRDRNRAAKIHLLGGDRDPGNKDVVRHTAYGIVETDTVAPKLMSCHTASNLNGGSAGALNYFPGEAWCKVDNSYDVRDDLYNACLSIFNRPIVHPYWHIEWYYENGPEGIPNPSKFAVGIRAAMWQPMLCGACGFTFGNDPVWFNGTGWKGSTGLGSPGHAWFSRACAFFDARTWWKLVPDQAHAFVTSGFGTSGNFVYGTAALASDRTWGACHLTGDLDVTVAMHQLRGPALARWFDPTSGTYANLNGGVPLANAGSIVFEWPGVNAAGHDDRVLVLDVV